MNRNDNRNVKRFTHNLNIMIVDAEGAPITPDDQARHILNLVYGKLANQTLHKQVRRPPSNFVYEHDTVNVEVTWHRKYMKQAMETFFMGDLFTHTDMSDGMLLKLTGSILHDIETQIRDDLGAPSEASCSPVCFAQHVGLASSYGSLAWHVAFYVHRLMDYPHNYNTYVTRVADEDGKN